MVPSRSGPLLAAPLALALLSLPACTQEERPESGVPAAEAPSPQEAPIEEVAPHEMTCAEINESFGDEEHEEEASYLLVWGYGVRTGDKDLDFDKHPVTPKGLEEFITRLVLACEADPDKLFVDAILE